MKKGFKEIKAAYYPEHKSECNIVISFNSGKYVDAKWISKAEAQALISDLTKILTK